MPSDSQETLIEMFIFETEQLLENLEQIILDSEERENFTPESINEIFRIMHTTKGSATVMGFENMSLLAHTVEDLFHYIRENHVQSLDFAALSDLILRSIDFLKAELLKVKAGDEPDGSCEQLISDIETFLSQLKGASRKRTMQAIVYFQEDCGMENVRAFNIVHQLQEIADQIEYIPADIKENPDTAEMIRREGFQVRFRTDQTYKQIHHLLSAIAYLKDMHLSEWMENHDDEQLRNGASNEQSGDSRYNGQVDESAARFEPTHRAVHHQSMISVSVNKLDTLMDLIGELVISEAMVTQNPDLQGLELDNFVKSARQLRKIINELQDVAMSIRMVPLSMTFQRMHRIVRDMGKKLNKEVRLEIIGEETEVDKNIIEHISDPLMHLIRNAIDHGIETAEERERAGKPRIGTVTLEAKNSGGDVLILVKDDGRGLNRERIYRKAKENGLTDRPEEELTDREIFSYIFLPGFSTNDSVTEYSGRGVGMDVVSRNIGVVGGTITVDSKPGEGTVFTVKIPLTLAIMDGMNVRVGRSIYTLPINSVKESFKAESGQIITDPNGHEMIMIRGHCYSVLRLHELYQVQTDITDLSEGIMVMVEHDGKEICIFVDELIGQQQVVVKAMPAYIRRFRSARGLAGCTLLGDGSISLILDVGSLIS